MTLIFCLDKERGVAFGGRRQSRDRELCADILKDCVDTHLAMSAYSAKLFESADVLILESPTAECDAYFLELKNPADAIHLANRVVIYNWNRHYPSDIRFDADLSSLGFALTKTQDISGYSHEKITKEIYERL